VECRAAAGEECCETPDRSGNVLSSGKTAAHDRPMLDDADTIDSVRDVGGGWRRAPPEDA